MKTNPGGQLAISEIIGRDQVVRRLWKVLERQSLILTAERRTGKTHVLKKLMATAPDGMLVIPVKLPRDLERVHTASEFAECIFSDAEEYLSGVHRYAKKTREFLKNLGGAEVGGVFKFPELKNLPWKDVLIESVGDLIESQDKRIVFVWDEVPAMLFNIAQQDKQTAMQLLDTLRALRQTHPTLRMIYTGSIGLHLLLADLKRDGYANAPINDMATEELLPLELDDARELALKLLAGESIVVDDLHELANEIATSVERVPYYIHHVIDRLQSHGIRPVAGTVGEIISDLLFDPADPCQMRYYQERIGVNYRPDDRPVAFAILDSLSVGADAIAFNDLFNLVKSKIGTEDRDACLRVTTLLLRDHYLNQDKTSRYGFRLNLIKRSWRHQRGL